jgi:hypothetical protein
MMSVMAPNPSSGLRNGVAGQSNGDASCGGERGKNGSKHVMSGIAGKYPEIFPKESQKNLLSGQLFHLHYWNPRIQRIVA